MNGYRCRVWLHGVVCYPFSLPGPPCLRPPHAAPTTANSAIFRVSDAHVILVGNASLLPLADMTYADASSDLLLKTSRHRQVRILNQPTGRSIEQHGL